MCMQASGQFMCTCVCWRVVSLCVHMYDGDWSVYVYMVMQASGQFMCTCVCRRVVSLCVHVYTGEWSVYVYT